MWRASPRSRVRRASAADKRLLADASGPRSSAPRPGLGIGGAQALLPGWQVAAGVAVWWPLLRLRTRAAPHTRQGLLICAASAAPRELHLEQVHGRERHLVGRGRGAEPGPGFFSTYAVYPRHSEKQ